MPLVNDHCYIDPVIGNRQQNNPNYFYFGNYLLVLQQKLVDTINWINLQYRMNCLEYHFEDILGIEFVGIPKISNRIKINQE